MSRRAPWLLTALLFACDPHIEKEERAELITARFDPGASPAVVPSPNDLATDPDTGLLAVPIPETATGADREFYEYLNSLSGFPPSATAVATFDGELDPNSVTTESVKVYDVTTGTTVSTSLAYSDVTNGDAKGQISVSAPMGGWIPSHAYAVGLGAGSKGLKGAGGTQVVASATWAFVRSSKPLVTCPDISSPDCRPATEIIPSAEKDDAEARFNDQGQSAIKLERLRNKYAAAVSKFKDLGIQPENLVLAWTFKISDDAQVVFDPSASPPRVPLPNDLATDPATGLIRVPIDGSYSDAYKEFINDYLNTLDGFPVSATAQVAVAGGDVDSATVTPETVVVLPLDLGPALGEANISWNAGTKTIDVKPPNGSWGKARHLAIAVLGRRTQDVGIEMPPAAVERVGGEALVASSVWALVRSASPLVDCPNADLKSAECKLTITAAPLTVGQAIQLETLRRLYSDALDALEAAGHSRTNVAVLWTFKTVSFPEATFDPSASIIPFPNNLLRTTGAGAHLNLPVPDGGSSQALFLGLNTLDGFSTTAPIISESSDTRGAIDLGQLDPDTLDAGAGLIRLNAGDAPVVEVCLNCESTLLADGGTPDSPQQLQIVPRVPLTETSPYAAFLSNGLKDLDGNRVIASPTFALLRLVNELCSNMKSTVPVLTDAQACGVGGVPGLEQLRVALKPVVDLLVTKGITRKRLALAWAFNTQGTVSELSSFVTNAPALSTAVTASAALPAAAVFAAGLPNTHVGGVYVGTLTLPFGLTGTGATLRPPNAWTSRKAAYMLTVPTTAAPDGGYPVAVFGHGLSGHHRQMVAIADTLASAGFATIATDVVYHGERNSCVGYGAYVRATTGSTTAVDDDACTLPGGTMPDPVNARCDTASGRCVSRTAGPACATDPDCLALGQGYCTAGNTCEAATFAPQSNAWAFLNLGNLFAARDNFRHFPIDLAQLVKVAKAGSFPVPLDATKLNYVGQSLGGFNGTLFAAVNDDVKNVMLNVPGADQVGLLLGAPGFATVRAGFLSQLRAQGLSPGMPAFDQLSTLFRTIFDRADPQNFAFSAVNHAMTPARKIFIQSIEGDLVVLNSTTDKLIAAATAGGGVVQAQRVVPPQSLMAADRHGFLLNFKDATLTGTAQGKAAVFLSTGVAP